MKLTPIIAAGIISVVVATIGGSIQQAVTTQTGKIQESIAIQTTGKDYVQLALNIFAKKDLPDEMQKKKGLRQWACGFQPDKVLTSITSPQGIIFSPDDEQLMVFNEQSFARLSAVSKNSFITGPTYALKKEVSPLHGISKIAFSGDSKSIFITVTDKKEVRCDLDGNEIK